MSQKFSHYIPEFPDPYPPSGVSVVGFEYDDDLSLLRLKSAVKTQAD